MDGTRPSAAPPGRQWP